MQSILPYIMKLILSLKLFFLFVGLALAKSVPKEVFYHENLLEVSHANDDFDTRLLQEVEAENSDQNVFISSFSVSSALTMLMTGGVDATYNEVHDVLG